MKTISKLLLMITLLSSVLNAESRNYISQQTIGWYKMNLFSDQELEKGLNQIKVELNHKEHNVVNATVKIEIENNDKTEEYFVKSVDKLGNYIFEVNLPKEGTYFYRIAFNRVGENIRYFTGKMQL